jgi:F-type H+-transporting ATPase subunit epsilon
MANLTHAELVTPERVLYSGDAEAVIMRVDGGDTTFLANHSDFIGAVDICVVRIQAARASGSPAEGVAPGEGVAPVEGAGGASRAGGTAGESTSLGEVRAAVHGGFVKVADNKVMIVAGVAELADEIDVARARRALETAEAAESPEASGAPDGPDAAVAVAVARARVRLDAARASSDELSATGA